jgi:prephenate dehydrogenase
VTFRRVALVGCGMIGGSLAGALKHAARAADGASPDEAAAAVDPELRIVGADASVGAAALALALGFIDETADVAGAAAGADLVVLAVPVRAMPEVFERLAPAVAPNALVTDVGSTKRDVLAAARRALPFPERFVGAHPLAGTERSGPDAADPALFRGRRVLLTPAADTRLDAVAACEALWRAAGARTSHIDVEAHGRRGRRRGRVAGRRLRRHHAHRRVGSDDVARHLRRQPRRAARRARSLRRRARPAAPRDRRRRPRRDRRVRRRGAPRPRPRARGQHVSSTAAAAVAAAVALAGCGGPQHLQVDTMRPVGEDMLALLPSGADLVVDVDLEQLRAWPAARRVLELLPEHDREKWLAFGFDPASGADSLALALAGVGGEAPQATTVVRGDLDEDKARERLIPPVAVVDYHGVRVTEGPTGAFAKIAPRLHAFGAPVDVRRVIDLSRQGGESVRGQNALMDAYVRAPTARVGRPAVIAALVPNDRVREQLRQGGLPVADARWFAFSLAIGDGFDAVMINGLGTEAEAAALAKTTKQSLAQMRERPVVRILGLRPLVDGIAVRARESELRLAARIAGREMDRLLDRFETMDAKARRPLPPPVTPESRPESPRQEKPAP